MGRDFSLLPTGPLDERAARPSKGEREGFWFWIAFSGLAHVIVVLTLYMVPHAPARRAPVYPIYTVDLVGGEKIGAEAVGPLATPAERETKIESKKIKAEPLARVQEPRQAEKKVKEKIAPADEKVALKASKRQAAKELQAEQTLRDQLRDKRIEAAVESARRRAEQQKQKTEVASSGSGAGQGAAAPVLGGRGGGVVKSLEFLVYRNRVLEVIRERFIWLGKRTDLQTVVRFSVQDRGEVYGVKIVQSSGDSSYDDSVVQAVQKASPLPAPPEAYRGEFKEWEIVFCPKKEDACG